ncbi:MAG TPA: four helix bundle protein [Gemmatimonadaceae bacterium]|nr:four helix bundle protein [Gemmatimonadaceae bacterium]
MQNPDNLRVAADAKRLANAVYAFTRDFPKEERFGLAAQMRRAAVSIGSNIFEGCGRQGKRGMESNASLRSFLYIAHGSSSELLFQLRIARRQQLGDPAKAESVARLLAVLQGRLRRLILSLTRRMQLHTASEASVLTGSR